MKNSFFLFIAITCSMAVCAQSTESDAYIYLNEQEFTVYSSDYKTSKSRVEEFLRSKNYSVVKQEETKTSHYYEFNVPMREMNLIDSLTSILGYVSSKQLTSYNNAEKLEAAKIDLAFEENKKREYEIMLAKMDSMNSQRYYLHWEKIRDIESDIAQTKKRIAQLEKISPLFRVKLTINDEQVNPTNTRVSFINMPGVQYSMLFTENPKAGFSLPAYQGVFLKYLFTKGKSYFSLGVLKGIDLSKSDTLVTKSNSEIFNFAFGQDFYSKRFGRGNNRFLNLYVSYQVGASMYFNTKNTVTVPFANPGLGLEIFKNKNVLIDANVFYFLPLNDTYNRGMRGWLPSLSMNFVF